MMDKPHGNAHGDAHEMATEKVLAALRSVEPSPGMNDRILRALHEQQAKATLRPAFGKFAAFTVAATAAAVIALMTTRRPTGAPMHQEARVLSPYPATAPVVTTFTRQAVSTRTVPRQRPIHTTTAVTALKSEDELALEEMTAPSKPAPPLPLTAQEKLLLRVVHTGDNDEYSLLSADLRAENEERLRERFPTVNHFEPYTNQ